MNDRRNFLKLTSAAAIPAVAAVVSSGVAQADDGSAKEFLGSWNTIHSLPFPPGHFREFLSFADGGVVHETNSFLHTASNLDFSMYGLPTVVNAADGIGSWELVKKGVMQAVFRKMLFDNLRRNFGDLLVTVTIRSDGAKLVAEGHIKAVDLFDNVLADFGPVTSVGSRIPGPLPG